MKSCELVLSYENKCSIQFVHGTSSIKALIDYLFAVTGGSIPRRSLREDVMRVPRKDLPIYKKSGFIIAEVKISPYRHHYYGIRSKLINFIRD